MGNTWFQHAEDMLLARGERNLNISTPPTVICPWCSSVALNEFTVVKRVPLATLSSICHASTLAPPNIIFLHSSSHSFSLVKLHFFALDSVLGIDLLWCTIDHLWSFVLSLSILSANSQVACRLFKAYIQICRWCVCTREPGILCSRVPCQAFEHCGHY